ncbi:hypothetical protein [Chryseobacterium sp. EO14]|uniref:hypothetical protein n=1 Tax=Chryseobacterium sp. EO14 TaxID=2950551 RepID=UPI00210A8866|nr:hypothetical protein [Chryseobacterium sp. EO14]MCQ4142002.1 hypothetical protein [Chryseobacterium sp. EO14]
MFTTKYLKALEWLFPVPEQQNDVIPPVHSYLNSVPLQKVITNFLAWNGIDKKGNVTSNRVYPNRIEILETRTEVKKCGFSTTEFIEKLVVSEFLEMKKVRPNLIPEKFFYHFEYNYHNLKLVKFTTLEAQKSNEITKEHYGVIKRFLMEIQGYLEVVDLRTRIECDFTDNGTWYHCSKVEEFVTPFAKVSLICNKSAKFCINYFINPHLNELIGEVLGDIVEKRFDELAKGEMKDFVKLVPLNRRYDRYFEELVKFTKIYPNYKAVITEKNSL